MKISIILPDDILEEVKRLSKARTRTEAIILSLKEYIKKKRIEEIINMEGKLEFSDDMERLRHD
ncbi:MAG: type II toxin-antitoxin system VapB family antitoxin [Acidobacteriota bacterium]